MERLESARYGTARVLFVVRAREQPREGGAMDSQLVP